MDDFHYFFYKLRLGNFGLAQTFWKFLIGAWVAETLLVFMLYFSFFNLSSLASLIQLAFGFLYLPPAILGTWNAAVRYTGPKIWAWLAQAVIILIVLYYVMTLWFYLNVFLIPPLANFINSII
jgi:hypothetical protein